MKRSKFSQAQIALVLKQAGDGTTIGEMIERMRLPFDRAPEHIGKNRVF